MSENFSTNLAALRREARRRRILDNSENRLRSITGKAPVPSSNEDKPRVLTCFKAHSHDEFDSESFDDIADHITRDISSEEVIANVDFAPKYLGSLGSEVTEGIQVKASLRIENPFLSSIIKKRFHYVILSMVVHFLLLSKLGFLFYDNVLCPFLTVRLMEFMLFTEQQQIKSPNLLSVVASISRGSTISYALKGFSILTALISDFFLYMFVFILVDKLYNSITGS